MDNSNQNDPNNPNPSAPPFGAPPTVPDPIQQPVETPPQPQPWPNIPQAPIQPPAAPQLQSEQTPSLSPLDNPWGSAIQTPPIDNAQPTWAPTPTPIPPAPISVPEQAIPDFPAVNPTEGGTNQDSAPTDLSHLISNQPDNSAQMAPETLVVPSGTVSPEVSVPTEGHKGIPKWLIGVGIGLILVVAAASAYFILGIGQPSKTTSLPATTTRASQTPRPVVTPEPSAQAAATGSANFGEVQGNAGTNTATSAADLIRQRQQGL